MTMRSGHRIVAALALVGLVSAIAASSAAAADWTRFRGPNGSGIATDEKPVPDSWSASKNRKWKTELPGPGASSPIVVGDRVFVTAWSGYGVDRGGSGDQKDLRRHLVCIDRQTGDIKWTKTVEPDLPEDRYASMFAENGYASHSPVSDGQRVYVFFGKTGVLAYDLEGNQLWHKKVGSGLDPRNWGSASSPILYKNLLIVTASAESKSLIALNKETGEEVWKKTADGLAGVWGTPVLVEIDENRTDLVLAVPNEIWGFNPDTGKFVWYCLAMRNNSYCSSLVAENGIVYAIESMGGGSIAVRAGGEGDVTDTHVVWSGRDNSRIATPLVHEGRIYFVARNVANCLDASDGSRVYRTPLTGGTASPSGGGGGTRPAPGGFGGGGMRGQDYSSPVAAGGKVYYVSRSGDGYVYKLGDELEQISNNRLSDARGEEFVATPAVSDGELFIRSSTHLYCIAEK
jgi:hypothetical protein